MTQPINSVSDERLKAIAVIPSRADDAEISEMAAELWAARRTANTPVDGEVDAMKAAIDDWDRNTCVHETVHRGGSIWTICDDCGRKWADDRGGFVPYSDPPGIAALRAHLAILRTGSSASPALPSTKGHWSDDKTYEESPALPSQVVGVTIKPRSDEQFQIVGKAFLDALGRSSPAAEPVAWSGDHQVAGEYTRRFTAMKRVAEIWAEQGINVTPLYPAPSASREVTEYLVWSNEHRAWWRHKSQGYARNILEAGRYTRAEAIDIADKSRNGWELDRRPDEIAVAIADLPPPIRAALLAALPEREGT